MLGKVTNPKNEHLPDLNWREWAYFTPLIALAFWIGLYPKPLFDVLDKPVANIVMRVRPDYYQNQNRVREAAVPAPAPALIPVSATHQP